MTQCRVSRQLSIIVPAYNEETKLAITLDEILQLAETHLDEYEVIVVDDGSVDQTLGVAQGFATQYPEVRVLRHEINKGVGASYVDGLAAAKFAKLTLIPGDNAFASSGVERIFKAVNEAELIVSYRANPQARTPLRRWLSRFATLLVRGITGRSIRDAHSMYVFPVEQARAIKVSPGYSYHVESLCRLLLIVSSYKEVPVELNPKPDASSGVMKARTIGKLAFAVGRLYGLRLTGRLRRSYDSGPATPPT